MARELTFRETLLGLMAFAGGIGLIAFAMLAWIEGFQWQTGVFSIGSLYTMSWSWARLTGRA